MNKKGQINWTLALVLGVLMLLLIYLFATGQFKDREEDLASLTNGCESTAVGGECVEEGECLKQFEAEFDCSDEEKSVCCLENVVV